MEKTCKERCLLLNLTPAAAAAAGGGTGRCVHTPSSVHLPSLMTPVSPTTLPPRHGDRTRHGDTDVDEPLDDGDIYSRRPPVSASHGVNTIQRGGRLNGVPPRYVEVEGRAAVAAAAWPADDQRILAS